MASISIRPKRGRPRKRPETVYADYLCEKTQRRALQILNRSEQTRTTAGKGPMGLAASALYIACVLESEQVTQRDVARAAGVTEVTIRNSDEKGENGRGTNSVKVNEK